jgi:hypothetical protein
MLYLVDSCVLITAHNNYDPLAVVPEFWAWLLHQAKAGVIKIPLEMYEEVKDGGTDTEKDALYEWIRDPDRREALVLRESADVGIVQMVVDVGYANDLNDAEVEQLGRDPFVVAYALADTADRIVVTAEVSKPKRKRQNRHLPDVCDSFGVTSCDTFKMLRDLEFHTGWNKGK